MDPATFGAVYVTGKVGQALAMMAGAAIVGAVAAKYVPKGLKALEERQVQRSAAFVAAVGKVLADQAAAAAKA